MKRLKRVPIALSLLAFLAAIPVFASGPAFQTTSAPRALRNEGLTEVAGEVVLQVTNPSASTTIVTGSSLAFVYTTQITVAVSNANVVCVIGGVLGCPAGVNLSLSGNTLILSFSGPVTLSGSSDGFTITGLRMDVTGLKPGASITASISTNSPSPATNPITITQSSLIVGTTVSALGPSVLTPAANPQFTCVPPGTVALPFTLSVMEGFNSAFTTKAQEAALSGTPTPTSGTTIEVLIQNVPVGVTITPTSASSQFGALPVPIMQVNSGAPVFFSFPIISDDPSNVETATLTFAAGYSSVIDVSTITGPLTFTVRLGPVATGTTTPVISFMNNTETSGTPFTLVSCALQTSVGGPLKVGVVSGSSTQANFELFDASTISSTYTSTVTTTSGGTWLSLNAPTGTQPANLSALINATNLAAGTYNGSIVFSAFGSLPVTLPVILTVSPNVPSIVLSPTSLTFNALLGGTSAFTQTVSVNNGQGGPLNWTTTSTTASGGTWLTVTPASSTTAGLLTASVSTTGLVAGTYTGSIQVVSTGASNTPQTIPVTLVVQTPPTIAATPTSLLFTAAVGVNPATQTIQINNSGGGSLGLAVVAASQTGNWLSVTPSTGVAPVTETVSVASSTLVAGTYTGTITISAVNSPGITNSPQTITVTLNVGTPLINAGGVVNAASYASGVSVAPGSIASLFGVRLATATVSAPGLPLPTALAGTQVFVNGSTTGAPLFSVAPTQINFQMPVESTSTTASVVVVSNGLTSPALMVSSGTAAAGIFTANSAGSGQAAAVNSDGSANSATNPAAAGSLISIYTTGLGLTNPAVITGQTGAGVEPLNRTVVTPTVTINGVSGTVQFSGLAPGFVGLNQLNVFIPQGTPAGPAVNVQVTLPGVASNLAMIAVK
jgi:uncharacterized protein (TIGR03437 family)